MKQLSRKQLYILAVAAVVIVAAGVAGLVMSKHKSSNTTANTKASRPQTEGEHAQAATNGASQTSQSAKTEGTNATSGGSATANNATKTATVSAISIKDMAFSPASATVKKGTPITWTNNDSMTHAIAETDSQPGPHSPQLKPGESYTFSFTKLGTYKYNCPIHPSMTATITVVD